CRWGGRRGGGGGLVFGDLPRRKGGPARPSDRPSLRMSTQADGREDFSLRRPPHLTRFTYALFAVRLAQTGNERLRLNLQSRVDTAAKEVHDDNRRKSGEIRRLPVRGKWSGAGSRDHRRDVHIDLLRKSR